MAEQHEPDSGGTGRRRRAYHHGDLRNALLEAAVRQVRENGPDAVVLREVARATGVSSTAAYRHFANHQDLIEAVKQTASDLMAASVRAELAAAPPSADPAEEALRRVRAAGSGYVSFARAEPGLFRIMFRGGEKPCEDPVIKHLRGVSDEGIDGGVKKDASYTILAEALDDLVVHGVLSPARRPFADVALWSAVHGICTLLLESDLAALPEEAKQAAVERTFDVLLRGIDDREPPPAG
ncbi:TetR/AcrR family transcriptional regulator [Yinghuangia seranimata]|uniref:TetR/AcrR family transcriptional regulator n=1 Tax=Yinghuangia seranimata TaxID=408067 RepID=UPI00248C5790|nr:TetR/AcrR family transcriptional regulator [Yinghuangia seranimata]MDI2132630.1 TetR/AcrR family transcriptional regulator [Yinghuangia seranimata]